MNNAEPTTPTPESLANAGSQDDLGAPALGPVESSSKSLITNTCQDDSQAPVHVQVKACATTSPQAANSLDCGVDLGYALVGGGAYAQWTGNGALLTSSRYVDGRTWHGSSKDHEVSDPHYLVTYAVGLRLDGVNAATLRGLLGHDSVTAPSSPTAHPAASMSTPQGGTSAGAQTNTSGPGQLLTRVVMDASTASAESKDHDVSSPGTITDSTTYVRGTFGSGTIIEGFGALEFQYMSAPSSTVSTGIASSMANVSAGWALAGFGGDSTYTVGGRMLFRIGPNAIGAACNARSVLVQSKDHMVVSGGTTTASWTQVRKVPNSHGLCNVGTALSTGMDPCVASICAAGNDPYCCSGSWDDQCVNEVTSICGRSCDNYRCALPSWTANTDTYWNSSTVKPVNNCYNFATNTQTGTSQGGCAQPGTGSGEMCLDWLWDYLNGPALIRECVRRDGLLWNDTSTTCPTNMDLVALVLRPEGTSGYNDYHWFRKDTGGTWSQKAWCGGPATNMDLNTNPQTPISDPPWATAARANYTVPVGYFCVCSSATEGAGHSVIL